MKAVLICRDKPGALEVRKANRDAHLAYIEASGCVLQAGPFLDAEGDMTGSLVVLEVRDMAAARAWAEADPYAKAGLFESVEIEEWKQVVG